MFYRERELCSYSSKQKTKKLGLKDTYMTFGVLFCFLSVYHTHSMHGSCSCSKKTCRYKSIYMVKGYRNIACRTFSKEAIKSILAVLVLYFILHATVVYITCLIKCKMCTLISLQKNWVRKYKKHANNNKKKMMRDFNVISKQVRKVFIPQSVPRYWEVEGIKMHLASISWYLSSVKLILSVSISVKRLLQHKKRNH